MGDICEICGEVTPLLQPWTDPDDGLHHLICEDCAEDVGAVPSGSDEP